MRKLKKKYVAPEMEITEFETEDVITTSNPSGDQEPIDEPYSPGEGQGGVED